jgi:hypothetical protein
LEAESAARELGELSLSDALALLLVIAAREPAQFEPAAIRWHGRFEVNTRGVGFAESEMLLRRAPRASARFGLETIARLAERFRTQSVALEARRLAKKLRYGERDMPRAAGRT